MRKRWRPIAYVAAMPRASLKRLIVFYLAAAALISFSALATALSREEGDRLQRKIDDIAANASARTPKPKITPIPQTELNSYLAYNLRDKIPRGLARPEITIVGDGALAGRVLVDIDEFKRGRDAQDFLDPLNYISGQVPVTARGVLRTENGKGRFQLGSAELMGVPIPLQLAQELVAYFSRTAENPRGLDLNAPFDLPAKIRRIEIKQGEARIAQ
jgi:hypothetical protein